MARPTTRKPQPVPEVDEELNTPFTMTDADLAQKHMRVLVKDIRPLMTLGEWLVVCAALDSFIDTVEGSNPAVAETAERLLNDWTQKAAEATNRMGGSK